MTPAAKRRDALRYHVKAWASWRDVGDGRPLVDRYHDTAADALAAADACPWPLVDVIDRDAGLILAARSTLPHPQSSPEALASWQPRDTLAATLHRCKGSRP